MREIKFRGYSKNYKKMFSNATWEPASDGMVKICNEYFKEHRIDTIPVERGLFIPTKDADMTLMQCTCLKDKNGIEIYEGDILAPITTWNESKYIIEWDKKNCCFTSIDGGAANFYGDVNDEIKYNLLSNMRLDLVEIIGNIYENPDLFQYRI